MVSRMFGCKQGLHLIPFMHSLIGVNPLGQIAENRKGVPLHIQIQHSNLERREVLRFIDYDMVKTLGALISAEQIMDIEQRRQILLAQDAFFQILGRLLQHSLRNLLRRFRRPVLRHLRRAENLFIDHQRIIFWPFGGVCLFAGCAFFLPILQRCRRWALLQLHFNPAVNPRHNPFFALQRWIRCIFLIVPAKNHRAAQHSAFPWTEIALGNRAGLQLPDR
ncbi:hypothetical protein D3C81_1438250 [compost metagenome]